MNYSPFLRWLLVIVTFLVGFFFATKYGLMTAIYYKDDSRICFVILGILLLTSAWCGKLTYKLHQHTKGECMDTVILNKLESTADFGWFIADMCLSLGMLGTVIGFIMILVDGFTGVTAGDVASVQKLFTVLSVGLGTALYTTLIGLIASLIVKIQFFNLCHTIDLIKIGNK